MGFLTAPAKLRDNQLTCDILLEWWVLLVILGDNGGKGGIPFRSRVISDWF